MKILKFGFNDARKLSPNGNYSHLGDDDIRGNIFMSFNMQRSHQL